MRFITLALLVLLGLVHGSLWFGDGGMPYTQRLQSQLDAQLKQNEAQRQRNVRLVAEVEDLRQGLEMVEDRARSELGMIKPDEIFVQITRH
ncbi:cell division protein FtsB [Aquabacterium sp.]|uniref:cell division protein FtsB n=1 Tax=Aquabacterium sp. TaxID=1872578 RepID=UPI002B88EA4E|nr:cell division protein FtsB [Aquabacterium sp.]HSW08702.1 cell division protein FtsB [Aquabacterium sp.]